MSDDLPPPTLLEIAEMLEREAIQKATRHWTGPFDADESRHAGMKRREWQAATLLRAIAADRAQGDEDYKKLSDAYQHMQEEYGRQIKGLQERLAQGEPVALTVKGAWWAGYRAGKGLPADTPRQAAIAADRAKGEPVAWKHQGQPGVSEHRVWTNDIPLYTRPFRSEEWLKEAERLADEYADEAVMHASASAGNALAARAAFIAHLKGEKE